MIEEGYVHDVRLVTLGSFLDGEHLTGSTTLKIMDAADFNEEGGSFILDEQTLTYLSADMEADTLTLASPLATDYEEGVPLYISPLTYEKQAVVVLDGFDEAITAVVPHSLYDRLAEGMREDFNRESVTIELENSTWMVKNVYGKEPVIDGQYLENVVADDIIDGIVTTVKLANDAVTQAKVAVGAIGPVELAIGTGNLLPDGSFEKEQSEALVASSPFFSLVTPGNNSPKALRIDVTAGGATTRAAQLAKIPVNPGDRLYLAADWRVSSTWVGTYVKVYARWEDASGVNTGYGVIQDITPTPGAAWAKTAGQVQAPNGTVYAVIMVEAFQASAGWVEFDNCEVRTAVTTGLVQAGAITTNELATNSVTAGKIAALAVQAGNIAAGAIQAGDIAANAITTAKLDALAVTSDKIAANAITASKILAGEVTASKLDVNALIGKTAQSSNFVNDPEAGITGWQFNADGSAYLRSATIGNDLYSMSPTGDAKFQSLSVASLSLDGEDLESYISNLPRGIVNVYPLSGALTYAAINTDYLVTRFVIPEVEARMYRIILDNWRFDRGTGSSSPTQFGVDVYCKYGSQASNADSLIHTYLRGAGYNASAADDIWSASHDFSPPDANLGQDLHIAIYTSINSGAGNIPRLETTGNTRVIIEDVGGKIVYAPTVSITNYVAPAKTTYTKEYSSTWMSTWGVNSGRRTDGKAYQGNYSSTNGNNYTKYGFSSAIQTDLTGATVKKVEVYLDNNHFYSNSGGNAIIGTHANSTQPTGSSSTTGTYARQSTAFTYGQAKWVTLSSAFGTDLKSGAALGITLGRTSGGTLAEYGYFSSSAKLRITYEK